MAINFDAIISFVEFVTNGFRNIYTFFTWTVGEYIETIFGWIPAIGDKIADAINFLYSNIVINGVSLEDLSLLVIMFGYGMFFYLVYQFTVWLLNLIT